MYRHAFFEEPSVRETLAIPAEVRVWQEDQNPLAVVAGYLRDRKLASRPIGIEETARFFAFDGLQRRCRAPASSRPTRWCAGAGW